MKHFTKISFLCTIAAAMTFCWGCRSVPVTGRTQLMLTTEGYENELGLTAYDEYKTQFPQSTNAVYNKALARCGQAISAVSGRNDFDWQFTVLETETQNAFCLPGGKVAVYTGLMDLMNNEAELAFVVAHEIAHALARHSGERMSWGYLQSLGGLLVTIGLQSETADAIYGVGSELGVMLPFSRDNESEADAIGLLLMARAGYNPQAAVEFWSRFGQGGETDKLSRLLSTHPCDEDRIAAMKAGMAAAMAEYEKAKDKKNYGTTFRK